ncbi:B12-binding domain-containing radical SAM protein [Collibacillus ludicampi]|uniref:B12-binding domain-containing radical SAM protein n=1 Tax=Collibacillus ludicampi TaxID=2771369 RepID=A0AAV4LFU2_9BACL|nr:B12-binding domain-containing radical SAM protein [Collibacillus ludicampi]GIM46672.1 B12-binding domain-containing radical SAM protein [Collibacillus ludicampi]
MKIVLATLNAKYIHSSLALRYLRAYARRDFPDIDLCEYTIKDVAINVVADIYKRNPDVVGFSCYIWNIEETIPIIQMLRKIKPDVKIVLGGPEVSYDVKYWMERIPEVDVIVCNEGEKTFHHVLTEFQAEQRLELVPGIAFRHPEKGIVQNLPREKMNLEEIPSPYDDDDLPTLVDRIVYFECSRGCPFSCSYCLSSIETGVRYFPLERTLSELKRLIDAGVKTIKFVDRTFNIHRRYALNVFDFLIKNHKNTVFQFEITADILKPDVVQFLAENAPPGIFRFEIGVQSTNDLTNAIVQRKQNWEKLTHTVLSIKETGKITQHLDLIAGLPEEDYNSFRKTFNDVFGLEPEELQLGFLKMLRGTGVRLNADKYHYVYMDTAPYEILSNNVLSFDDVIRIKRVEDVLEKYWNAHRADRTVKYLIDEEFPSAFDFFQEFGDYWEEKGWNRIGHQLHDLFKRLYEFLSVRGIKNLEVAQGLMKLDYLEAFKNKPRGIWWDRSLDKRETQRIIQEIVTTPLLLGSAFANLELTEQDMHKHCLLEVIPFNPIDVSKKNVHPREIGEPHLLVVYYGKSQEEDPVFYHCPMSRFRETVKAIESPQR